MCVCNREGVEVGVAGERKCKMCVCNREGGVVGVAEERKCKMCVHNRGDQGSLTLGIVLHTHTHLTPTLSPGHTKSTQKYNIDRYINWNIGRLTWVNLRILRSYF